MLAEPNCVARLTLHIVWYPARDSDHSQVSGNSVRTLLAACGFGSVPGDGAAGMGAAPPANMGTSIFFRRTVHGSYTKHASTKNNEYVPQASIAVHHNGAQCHADGEGF